MIVLSFFWDCFDGDQYQCRGELYKEHVLPYEADTENVEIVNELLSEEHTPYKKD